jgi:triphosphatase
MENALGNDDRSGTQAVHKDALGVKAKPVRLKASMSVAKARRAIVPECLAQIAANLPAVRAREMGGVHQARVGLRRLDVALKAFGRTLPEQEVEDLRARDKALIDALAQARDLDVFVTDVMTPVQEAEENEALSLLAEKAEAQRSKVWDIAVAEVEKPGLEAFLDHAAALAQSDPDDESEDISLEEIAGRALDKFLAKARKRGGKIKSGDEHDFHRLRIVLKKLRYAAEFFQNLYDKDDSKPYLKTMKAALDRLGALHDVTAAREILKALSSDSEISQDEKAQINYAAGLVLGWHSARAKRMTKQILKCWDEFAEIKPFWH